MRVARFVLIVALVSAGCGRGLVRSTPEPGADGPTSSPGTASSAPSPTKRADPPSTGTLRLALYDDNGGTPAGVRVVIDGRTIASDAKGMVTFVASPGRYTAKVVKGCDEEIEVGDVSSASFKLIGGRVTEGRLRALWRHRFAPKGPVSHDEHGDWPIGETVDIGYTVFDRCSDKEQAANASLRTFVFDHSSNITLVGSPVLRSNDQGKATVKVRCTSAGSIRLVLRDRNDPSTELDLDDWFNGLGGRQRCGV